MAEVVRKAGVSAPPRRLEHVVTQSVRTAAAETAGQAPIPARVGRLALVTDGVHRELSAEEITAVLAYDHEPATAARELTDLALLAGGGDNASATVVEVPLVPALPAQRIDTGPAFPEVEPAESA
jgi:protein phosphatase